MRCRLPGPQDPAQTASSPVICDSAPAANAATSSVAHMDPVDHPATADRLRDPVQAVADETEDALHTGLLERFDEQVGDVVDLHG